MPIGQPRDCVFIRYNEIHIVSRISKTDAQGTEFPGFKSKQNCSDVIIPRDVRYIQDRYQYTMKKEKIIGFDALYNSMEKCKKNVSWKPSVAHFTHNWTSECRKLSNELMSGTYKERKTKYFTITDPKIREIMSISFRDRVYQRSLNDVALYPQTSVSYIPDNFACQKHKGTDKARRRLKEQLQSFYRKHGVNGYALQCDIHGFYGNINHRIAIQILNSYTDKETAEMADSILAGFPNDIGFNPGSQIVQIVGITFLDRLDHFIKERLRIKFYIRYMDDFILIHESKEYLIYCKEQIENKLLELELSFNPKKTRIYKVTDGILFLGFVNYLKPTGKVVIIANPKKIKHERKKLRRMANLVKQGKLSKSDFYLHFKDVKACLRYGNSYNLIHNLNQYVEELMREENDLQN